MIQTSVVVVSMVMMAITMEKHPDFCRPEFVFFRVQGKDGEVPLSSMQSSFFHHLHKIAKLNKVKHSRISFGINKVLSYLITTPTFNVPSGATLKCLSLLPSANLPTQSSKPTEMSAQ